MTVEQREKIITEIRRLTRAEAETMARLACRNRHGRVEHKTAKHLLVADQNPRHRGHRVRGAYRPTTA